MPQHETHGSVLVSAASGPPDCDVFILQGGCANMRGRTHHPPFCQQRHQGTSTQVKHLLLYLHNISSRTVSTKLRVDSCKALKKLSMLTALTALCTGRETALVAGVAHLQRSHRLASMHGLVLLITIHVVVTCTCAGRRAHPSPGGCPKSPWC